MLSSFGPDDRLVPPQGPQEDSATEQQNGSLKRLVVRITADASQFSSLRSTRVRQAADVCHCAVCCERVCRPIPASLRTLLHTCLSGGRCQPIRAHCTCDLRRSRTRTCWNEAGHLIDGVLRLTIVLLTRYPCCCDTAHKLQTARATTRPKLLQDTLKSLAAWAADASNNTFDIPKRMAPPKPRWLSRRSV